MRKLIFVDDDNQIFHLHNKKISYVFRVAPNLKKLEHIYFGKSIRPHNTVTNSINSQPAWGEKRINHDDYSSLSRISQEYPEFGTSDYRTPAFEISYPKGDSISNFEYRTYSIEDGAPEIKGMPNVRYSKDECQTLTIVMEDEYSGLLMLLNYTIDTENSSIVRNVTIENRSNSEYNIDSLKSMSLDIPNENFDLITLNGIWAREKIVNREKINPGIKEISSIRGASGHVHDPFIAIANHETTQSQGDVIGISTIYSGNHKETIELDSYDIVRVTAGINNSHFSWHLSSGESFTSPQSILAYSSQGFNHLSQTFHNIVRKHLIDSKWILKKHPILINNWEATYFNFNEDKIIKLADRASKVGCDLFVLDDGWFSNRNSEEGSLGDWTVDHEKLPNGLSGLSKRIHELGMDFGLWFEPESVSKNTGLYRKHPDWIIGVKGKSYSQGRNQYLLDFSNPEVVDNIYSQMDKVLSKTKIEYIKWDMNRNITEPYSSVLNEKKQGEFYHRYILGVYSLYEKLTSSYPNIRFESCASGGGRFDLGMLYYAPQTWGSDDTDAFERWQIQTGESYVYPLSSIGTHVSAVPNHQTGRVTPLNTRGNIALFGTFGYELDLLRLTDSEMEEIRKQISKRKKYDYLISNGDFYRLDTKLDDTNAWQVVSNDKKSVLVCYFKGLSHPNTGYDRVRLFGLNSDDKYLINDSYLLYGDELMNLGLPLGNYNKDHSKIDFDSKLFEIKAVE